MLATSRFFFPGPTNPVISHPTEDVPGPPAARRARARQRAARAALARHLTRLAAGEPPPGLARRPLAAAFARAPRTSDVRLLLEQRLRIK